jgi:aspartyl-tRNA(Asn)/glutamyl-tRNA(Gln) amidotransferase subunit B
MTGIDLNRAGTPLLEIVSEPDMRSPEEAVAYARKIHQLVRWIGICDGNMQEGSFRVDANVSCGPRARAEFGTRAEIKNINSFRFLKRPSSSRSSARSTSSRTAAQVVQETRLYDADKDETRSMRSKEEANDYRYFPDPDLLPLEIDERIYRRRHRDLPELPDAMRQRFERALRLSDYDAALLTASRAMADYFEPVAGGWATPSSPPTGSTASWPRAEQGRPGHRRQPGRVPRRSPAWSRASDNTISGKIAKQMFEAMWAGEGDADEVIEAKGLKQITDTGAIEAWSTRPSPPTRARSSSTVPARTSCSASSSARS